VSTHNPLGVTFAAGVYTSVFGSSKEPLNSIYSRAMFEKISSSRYRKNFKAVVGGSGGCTTRACSTKQASLTPAS
ncbi:MAG: hypothetical protein WAM58_05540, partial [Candidatus Acidiferrum sp.]